MKFTVSTVALLISTVAGAAVLKKEVAAAKSDNAIVGTESVAGIQAITHLYVCTDINFQGSCSNRETTTNSCRNLISQFQDNVSSAGPDAGTTCILYEHNDCKGRSLTITNPGLSNLHSVGFGDIISSYNCF